MPIPLQIEPNQATPTQIQPLPQLPVVNNRLAHIGQNLQTAANTVVNMLEKKEKEGTQNFLGEWAKFSAEQDKMDEESANNALIYGDVDLEFAQTESQKARKTKLYELAKKHGLKQSQIDKLEAEIIANRPLNKISQSLQIQRFQSFVMERKIQYAQEVAEASKGDPAYLKESLQASNQANKRAILNKAKELGVPIEAAQQTALQMEASVQGVDAKLASEAMLIKIKNARTLSYDKLKGVVFNGNGNNPQEVASWQAASYDYVTSHWKELEGSDMDYMTQLQYEAGKKQFDVDFKNHVAAQVAKKNASDYTALSAKDQVNIIRVEQSKEKPDEYIIDGAFKRLDQLLPAPEVDLIRKELITERSINKTTQQLAEHIGNENYSANVVGNIVDANPHMSTEQKENMKAEALQQRAEWERTVLEGAKMLPPDALKKIKSGLVKSIYSNSFEVLPPSNINVINDYTALVRQANLNQPVMLATAPFPYPNKNRPFNGIPRYVNGERFVKVGPQWMMVVEPQRAKNILIAWKASYREKKFPTAQFEEIEQRFQTHDPNTQKALKLFDETVENSNYVWVGKAPLQQQGEDGIYRDVKDEKGNPVLATYRLRDKEFDVRKSNSLVPLVWGSRFTREFDKDVKAWKAAVYDAFELIRMGYPHPQLKREIRTMLPGDQLRIAEEMANRELNFKKTTIPVK